MIGLHKSPPATGVALAGADAHRSAESAATDFQGKPIPSGSWAACLVPLDACRFRLFSQAPLKPQAACRCRSASGAAILASGARIELSPFRAISLSEMRPRHSLLPVEHWKVIAPGAPAFVQAPAPGLVLETEEYAGRHHSVGRESFVVKHPGRSSERWNHYGGRYCDKTIRIVIDHVRQMNSRTAEDPTLIYSKTAASPNLLGLSPTPTQSSIKAVPDCSNYLI